MGGQHKGRGGEEGGRLTLAAKAVDLEGEGLGVRTGLFGVAGELVTVGLVALAATKALQLDHEIGGPAADLGELGAEVVDHLRAGDLHVVLDEVARFGGGRAEQGHDDLESSLDERVGRGREGRGVLVKPKVSKQSRGQRRRQVPTTKRVARRSARRHTATVGESSSSTR